MVLVANRPGIKLPMRSMTDERTKYSPLCPDLLIELISETDYLLDILTHMSHHAAYHRGQVVQLIRPMLDEPPVTDFIVWTREE